MKRLTLRIPILLRKDVGLGDVVKKATASVGIKPCSACNKRAEKLNAAVRFAGSKKNTHTKGRG